MPAGGPEIRSFGREADKNVPSHRLTVQRFEPQLRAIEFRSHLSGGEEAPIELIGPLMIGTNELCGLAYRFGTDARTAMAAGIDEGADDSVCGASERDGIRANLQRDIAAGLRQLGAVRNEQPVPVEDLLQIESKDFGVGIELARQAGAGYALVQAAEQTVADRAHAHSRDAAER